MPDGDLPGEITEDILRRLPVKTLICFTAVCKSWYSLISSPNFIQIHLSRSSVDPRNQCLLLHQPCRDTITISPSGISPCSVIPICSGGTVQANRKPLKLRSGLVGSVNGLVCFSRPPLRPTNVAIWNPATRKFKDILVPHLNLSSPFRIYVAFAFDLVVSDYKIVCIYGFRSGMNVDMSFRFSMYSCNADSWKELKPDFPFRLDFISGCVTVKGNPYWMGFHEEKEIWFSVNVQTEAIRLFSRPEYFRNVATVTWPLNLSDSVAQIVRSPGLVSNHLVDVYILDEYSGVWNKIYTIGSIPLHSPQLLQCYKNGEFVIKDEEGKLFTYDPISKGIKDLGIGEGMEAHYMAITYSESLVNIGGMQCIGEEAGEEDAPGTSHRDTLNALLS